jgi:hypothetical protein
MRGIKPKSLTWSNSAIGFMGSESPQCGAKGRGRAQRTVLRRGGLSRVSQIARLTLSAIGMLALIGAAPAHAQAPRPPAPPHGENLSAGKTPAQLFASDCSACHRSPAGLAKGRGPGQIANFLVEHYTSSRQSAGLLGAYVASMRAAPPAATRTQPPAAAGPTAAAGPRPPGEVPQSEPPGGPALLQDEAQAEPRSGTNGRARPNTSRGRSQPAQAGQRPETAAAVEPETRTEAPPPAPPAPKTLDTLEVYD